MLGLCSRSFEGKSSLSFVDLFRGLYTDQNIKDEKKKKEQGYKGLKSEK